MINIYTKAHSNYNKATASEMKDAIFKHLYNMNITQLYREQKVITDVWLAICKETAREELDRIISDGNLRNYYKRLKEGAL